MAVSNKGKVALIDYDMGNLFSVKQACERVGLEAVVASDPAIIAKADAVILPGVGAFGDAMESLERSGLVAAIKDFVRTGRPFMGICLGMQLIMSGSEEFGSHAGLGLIEGSVLRFNNSKAGSPRVKVPQTGWNRIYASDRGEDGKFKYSPLEEIKSGQYMYFVHSFYAVPKDERVILSTTEYEGTKYCSSIAKDNIFACQFHPEKSGVWGLRIYQNWANIVNTKRGS